MIIHEPTITHTNGEMQISARFELDHPLPNLPAELWYRFPEHYEPWISPRSDAFTATALLVAMFTGEDLRIRGPVSPKLAYNLFEYRNVYHSWFPKQFEWIDIQFDQLQAPQSHIKPTAVVTAFSGGVDSFYTLWSHMPEQQLIPDYQVTHGMFVHGLDLRLDDDENYRDTASFYQMLYHNLGLELILASTNAYQFSQFRINWAFFDGAPLIGAALILDPLISRFYTPSGFPSIHQLAPQGTHSLLDHLLSTETIEIIHHGASISRYEKISVLAKWPVTYNSLRVCSDKQKLRGVENCSVCHKCYRTIAILEILDALQNYEKNFPVKLTAGSYLRWGLLTHLNPNQARSIRKHAWESKRIGMVLLIQIAIVLGILKKRIVGLLKSILTPEQLYWIKYRIYHPETGTPEE